MAAILPPQQATLPSMLQLRGEFLDHDVEAPSSAAVYWGNVYQQEKHTTLGYLTLIQQMQNPALSEL